MMKQRKWVTYASWILLSLGAGILSGLLSRSGTADFSREAAQPPLSPPAILFPPVWTVLYLLMGISAGRVSLSAPSAPRSRGLNLFVVQLVVNFFWSLIFFNGKVYGFAFLWLLLLWGLVFAMIRSFRKTDPPAALLQIPYLLWLTFAAYLNAGVWLLNS